MFKHIPKSANRKNSAVYSNSLTSPSALNKTLLSDFLRLQNETDIRKTHLFGGRYENIYLTEKHIPELASLIKQAITFAEDILQTANLRAGYWFNYMPPGSTTTLHTHDDDDELLSAVYYIHAPKNSGDLIIYDDTKNAVEKKVIISPEAGKFIFFKPNVRHEVSQNNSNEHRLSIGINFGIDKQPD